MKYKQILKELAKKHNTSTKVIEKEMKKALLTAGLNTSVEKFIYDTTATLTSRRYIV